VDAVAEIKAAGYDAQQFVRDIPINTSGVVVGNLDDFKYEYSGVFMAISSLLMPAGTATASSTAAKAIAAAKEASGVPTWAYAVGGVALLGAIGIMFLGD